MEHGRYLFQLRNNGLGIFRVKNTDLLGNIDLSAQLGNRTFGNMQKSNMLGPTIPLSPFSSVRRN